MNTMESPALAVMWAASRIAEAELEEKEEAEGRRGTSADAAASTENCRHGLISLQFSNFGNSTIYAHFT